MALPTTAAPSRPAPITPAAAPGLCLGGGGCDGAGDGEGSERKCCNFGFDRHDKLHPIEGGPLWSAYPVGRRVSGSGSNPGSKFVIQLFYSYYRLLTESMSAGISARRAVRKRSRIEFVDVGEQFAERACALIEQALAFFGR